MSNRKKGFSLIETVVALMMVMVAVLTLVINVVALNLLSRQKTEATALAQDGLAIAVSTISNGCPSTIPVAPWDQTFYSRYHREVTFVSGDLTGTPNLSFNPSAAAKPYVMVTSELKWNDKENYDPAKSTDNTYKVQQLVRLSND
jgi:type II secretory pathway pseudopilin PulG